MASEAATVLLTLVGIGIIVVGVMMLMQMRRPTAAPQERVVIREEVPRWGSWAPYYYSHIPVRPILY